MRQLFIVLVFAVLSGCATVSNDQSACTTNCNIGNSGYAGVGSDVNNDQSACTDDCNIGTTSGTQTYYWSSNVTYHPYHPRYGRGPMVIYHY